MYKILNRKEQMYIWLFVQYQPVWITFLVDICLVESDLLKTIRMLWSALQAIDYIVKLYDERQQQQVKSDW